MSPSGGRDFFDRIIPSWLYENALALMAAVSFISTADYSSAKNIWHDVKTAALIFQNRCNLKQICNLGARNHLPLMTVFFFPVRGRQFQYSGKCAGVRLVSLSDFLL